MEKSSTELYTVRHPLSRDVFFLFLMGSSGYQWGCTVTGWEMIHLLIFLLAAGFGDTHNPSNASLSILLAAVSAQRPAENVKIA